jgi:uncharacterized membrane protein YhaH (DUF805 family)
MLFVRPDKDPVPEDVARERYRLGMHALAASVAFVLVAMAAAIKFGRGLERADYALFALVLFCLAVLVPTAVVSQKRLLAKAVRADRRDPRRRG